MTGKVRISVGACQYFSLQVWHPRKTTSFSETLMREVGDYLVDPHEGGQSNTLFATAVREAQMNIIHQSSSAKGKLAGRVERRGPKRAASEKSTLSRGESDLDQKPKRVELNPAKKRRRPQEAK